MKNSIIIILILGFSGVASFSSLAQNDNEFGYVDTAFVKKAEKFNSRKVILKTNPAAIISGDIPFFTSEFRLVGEFVTGPKTGVVLGVSYLGMGLILRDAIDNDSLAPAGFNSWDIGVNGYRVQAGFKYYLKNPRISITDPNFNPAPKGLYLFPLVSYSTAKYYEKVNKDDYYRFTHLSATLNFGIQILMGDKMTLDPYVGIGYKKNTITDATGFTPADLVEQMSQTFIYGTKIKVNLGINIGFRF